MFFEKIFKNNLRLSSSTVIMNKNLKKSGNKVMKIHKILIFCMSLAGLMLVLGGCGQQKEAGQTKQVLNWSESGELMTIDPSTAVDAVSFDIINNSQEGLYRYTKNNKVEPALAQKMTVSDDGLTYTIDLKKNTKWSNGQPVLAKDFVYGWQRTVDPKTGSQYSYLFEGIQNATAIMEGQKSPDTLGIKAVGKYQLVITLEKDIPYFKLLLGFPSFYPQQQAAVEKYGKKYGTASKYMVYNGPFIVKDWTGSNLSWKMVKNKTYWDKKAVKLQTINFKVNKTTNTSYNMYQDKQLDVTNLSFEQAKQLKNDPAYTINKQSQTTYLEFNQTKKIFQNQKIRQAIAAAINKKQLATEILGNGSLPVDTVVASGLAQNQGVDFAKAITNKGMQYDKKKAQELWKEGLQELGLTKVSLTLLNRDTDTAQKVSEYLQSALEQTLPGLSVNVSNVPLKTALDRSDKGDYDITVSSWVADFADPITFLDMFTSGNSYNYGKWSNAQYDQLITASKTQDVNDPNKRWQDLVDASDVLNEQQGIVPLYQENQAMLLRQNVKELIIDSSGVTFTWKHVQIK